MTLISPAAAPQVVVARGGQFDPPPAPTPAPTSSGSGNSRGNTHAPAAVVTAAATAAVAAAVKEKPVAVAAFVMPNQAIDSSYPLQAWVVPLDALEQVAGEMVGGAQGELGFLWVWRVGVMVVRWRCAEWGVGVQWCGVGACRYHTLPCAAHCCHLLPLTGSCCVFLPTLCRAFHCAHAEPRRECTMHAWHGTAWHLHAQPCTPWRRLP